MQIIQTVCSAASKCGTSLTSVVLLAPFKRNAHVSLDNELRSIFFLTLTTSSLDVFSFGSTDECLAVTFQRFDGPQRKRAQNGAQFFRSRWQALRDGKESGLRTTFPRVLPGRGRDSTWAVYSKIYDLARDGALLRLITCHFFVGLGRGDLGNKSSKA